MLGRMEYDGMVLRCLLSLLQNNAPGSSTYLCRRCVTTELASLQVEESSRWVLLDVDGWKERFDVKNTRISTPSVRPGSSFQRDTVQIMWSCSETEKSKMMANESRHTAVRICIKAHEMPTCRVQKHNKKSQKKKIRTKEKKEGIRNGTEVCIFYGRAKTV